MRVKDFNGRMIEAGSKLDTPEQLAARSANGGARRKTKEEIDMIWDEVQAKNREGLGWVRAQ